MATATELTVAEELAQLVEVASAAKDWTVTPLGPVSFLLSVPAKGGVRLWVRCEADEYPTLPPIWRWCDHDGGALDMPHVTPNGGSAFFHGNGVICAPWNRLAYSKVDSRGPHGEWQISNWKAIPDTKECKTLAAMAIRIAVEACTKFVGMKGAA